MTRNFTRGRTYREMVKDPKRHMKGVMRQVHGRDHPPCRTEDQRAPDGRLQGAGVQAPEGAQEQGRGMLARHLHPPLVQRKRRFMCAATVAGSSL